MLGINIAALLFHLISLIQPLFYICLIIVGFKFLSIHSKKVRLLEKQNTEIIKVLSEIKEKLWNK
jgi:hypothetical protein